MQLHHILDYFIEYESNERFVQSSLKNKEGKDYRKEILFDWKKISNELIKKKVDKIYRYLKNDKRIEINLDCDQMMVILHNALINKNSDLIKQNITFEGNSRNIFDKMFTNLAKEQQMTVCYPLLERQDKRQPIFIFNFDFKEDEWKLRQFYLTKTSLFILVANFYKMDISSVVSQFEEEISKVIISVEKNIKGQSDIFEIISLVNGILTNYFPGFLPIETFNEYDHWKKFDKVFITTDQLDELYEQPFVKELRLVKEKITPKKNTPSTLMKYLLSNDSQKSYHDIKNDFSPHYGSYTRDYAINRKQWDVVKSVDRIELLSVNGPPGTGKTTLLKEIIADQLVAKAKELISKWDENWSTINEGKKQVYQSPFSGVNKHSIVVTSTNNKAVDNIGEELLKEIPYFDSYIQEGSENLGTLCARLGKKENVDKFKKSVFTSFLTGLKSDETCNEEVVKEFNKVYTELDEIYNEIKEFQTYYQELLTKLNVDHLDNVEFDLSTLEKKIQIKLSTNSSKYSEYSKKLHIIENNLQRKEHQLKENKSIYNNNQLKIREYYKALEDFKRFNRFKIFNVFSKKRKQFFKDYPTEQYISDSINDLKRINNNISLDNLEDEKNSLEREKNILVAELLKIDQEKSELEEVSNLLVKIKTSMQRLEKKLNISIGDPTENYQLLNVPKIVKLRKLLFDLSLKVQEEYVKKHKQAIIYNLEKVIQDTYWFKDYYNSEKKYTDKNKKGIKVLWETFFLCFPVITTTLHSFHSNNFQMIEGLFDLMLVDESGQILPHYLIGPLYRTRRVIAVGDVHQLEPIRLQNNNLIDMHENIQTDLQEYICIERNSVQSYVDFRSDIFEQDNEKKFGIILEEHRRCENSIVQFSNKYVYSNRLNIVNKDNHNKLFGSNLVAFDVRGIQTVSNVNELEVDICKKIIDTYVTSYGEEIRKDIAIITPYKNQELNLKREIKNISIGTVHTFQGQEKKIVLFSAVIDHSNKSSFIGNTPNMLNVAFTRGKEQVIFVGNVQAALDTKNYLGHAVSTIREYGVIYSLYNQELNSNQARIQNKYYCIFTNKVGSTSNELGTWINQYHNNGMINGPISHVEFLEKTLSLAEKSITIISPWITHYVVNQEFFNNLQQLLNKDVEVKIMFGYHKKDYDLSNINKIVETDYNTKESDKVYSSIKKLYDMINDQLVYAPPLHTKLLLIDQQYLVIGSFNWLSNKGKVNQSKDELSCILTDNKYIEYVKKHYLNKS